MDHFLTSDAMEPAQSEGSYSENLVRLPELSISYARPQLPKLERSREDFGLPEGKVLYLCCQSLFKYLPENDAVWVDIKKGCPAAHFVFINNKSPKLTQRFKERLEQPFKDNGLSLEQSASFVGPLEFQDYLQLNGLCDVYLDSVGWSGGNTSLEALAWGLPMVTFKANTMRGRHTAAILEGMSMGEWVADDRAGYVERAILLGEDQERRSEVSQLLMERSERIYSNSSSIRALEEFLRNVTTRE
jgi:predicted O-linked N-acetylglucosamine transferase (SPINDLY family)